VPDERGFDPLRVEAFLLAGRILLKISDLAFAIGVDFHIQVLRVYANEQYIGAAANLAIFNIGLLQTRTDIDKGGIRLATKGTEEIGRRLHGEVTQGSGTILMQVRSSAPTGEAIALVRR